MSSGTGFIVGTEGEIATNYHVIEGASSAIVKFYGHRGSHNVKSILHKDIENDIAVIKVHFKTTPLNFGDDNITQVGERIMAIGNPLGLTGTVSDGVVSGFRKMEDGSRRMQISAPISPGSSGGPVINKQGEVIGIATSYLPRGQNLNFAVPVTKLKRLMATRRLNIPFGAAHLPKAPKLKESTEIKVLKADWGGASLRDIHAVLHSTSSQLWPHAAQDKLNTILVNRSAEGPIVLFRRGDRGQYFVNLDTSQQFWCQYAFQFAHEFGHIMCEYKAGSSENQWFEESLCETASLFAMRRMSESWKTAPPYPNWKSYGPSFRKYAQNRIDEHPWPKQKSIAQWYRENARYLRKNSTDRKKNTALAAQLLPFFEETAEGWAAVAYLNIRKTNKARDFGTYLADWRAACPPKHKAFVTKIARLFGVELPRRNR